MQQRWDNGSRGKIMQNYVVEDEKGEVLGHYLAMDDGFVVFVDVFGMVKKRNPITVRLRWETGE